MWLGPWPGPGFNPSNPSQPLSPCPTSTLGRIGRARAEKLVGRVDSLIGKAKAAPQTKQNKPRNSFPTSHGRRVFSHPPGEQGPFTHKLHARTNTFTPNMLPSSFFPQLYILSIESQGVEYQSGSPVLAVTPPSFPWTPNSSPAWQDKEQKRL